MGVTISPPPSNSARHVPSFPPLVFGFFSSFRRPRPGLNSRGLNNTRGTRLQSPLEIFHQHAARNSVDTVAERLDLRLLDVELVLDRAYDLLDDIFQGDDSGHAAVLVDHGGEMEALGAHALQ